MFASTASFSRPLPVFRRLKPYRTAQLLQFARLPLPTSTGHAAGVAQEVAQAIDYRTENARAAGGRGLEHLIGDPVRTLALVAALLFALPARAKDNVPSRIDSITKSARDMMPSMPSVSLPSMPDLSLPDLSDPSGKLMAEFNSFTQQVGDALPLLEQMGYEVTTFKVTLGLPPKARLRLKSSGNTDTQKVITIAAKAPSSGVLVPFSTWTLPFRHA
ncbi:hypothetical protein [Bradyrhizobium ottawaense]|uniref:hypothetical protein n=1 Tax=Bradyrhizobium ottawaense TaxID=931866 RepID=UPI0015CF39DA|nr:hypothetical protein [Bradyrhizobium ottawaense]